jgi:regulator of replication initiation timing
MPWPDQEYQAVVQEVERLKELAASLSETLLVTETENERLRAEDKKLYLESLTLRTENERLKLDVAHYSMLAAEWKDTALTVRREADACYAENKKLRAAGDAAFFAMCDHRDNKDDECFQNAIDTLGMALSPDKG